MTLLDDIEGPHQKLIRPSGGCHNCPRRRVDFVPATLPKAQLIFLGEAPGATEVKEQEGFTGKSGELLRSVALEYGITEFAVSNVVHCRPPENAAPNKKVIDCCLSQFVLDEIRDYSIVVLVGSVPLQALFPKAKAWHFRGNLAYHPDFPEQRFYTMYHPAYILRNRGGTIEEEFKQQMSRLARIVRGEAEQDWNEAHGIEPEVDRSGWEIADIDDFRALIAQMNGNRGDLNRDNLQEHFDGMRRMVPSSRSTVNRWFRKELN